MSVYSPDLKMFPYFVNLVDVAAKTQKAARIATRMIARVLFIISPFRFSPG